MSKSKLEVDYVGIDGALCGDFVCDARVSVVEDDVDTAIIALEDGEWDKENQPAIALSADTLRALADMVESHTVEVEARRANPDAVVGEDSNRKEH